MEEIIEQVRQLLGGEAVEVRKKGMAEIDIVLSQHADGEKIAQRLKEHVASIVDENTIAKFNLQYPDGTAIQEFALNQ